MKFQAAHLGLILVLFTLNISSVWAASSGDLKAVTKRIAYDDLSRFVMKKNENVEASKLHVKAQNERTGKLARSFLPQLSAQVGEEQFKAGSESLKQQSNWKVEASLNIYRGGRDSLEDQVRKIDLSLAQTQFAAEYQSELLGARQAFLKALALSKKIENTKEAMEKNEVNIRSARKRAGAGITTAADTAQFELHRSSLNKDLIKLDHEHHATLIQLGVYLGLNEHENIETIGDFPKLTENEIDKVKLNTERQLDVLSYKDAQKISEMRAKQFGRWWLPRVDLYSSFGVPSLSDEYTRALSKDREWSAGVRMTIDLGRGIEDKTDASSQRFESESAKSRLSHKARAVGAYDHELRHNLSVLISLIQVADDDVEKANRFLKLTQNEYARGVKNGPDLLEAFQRYFEFRENRIQYYSDYFTTKTELERLTSGADAQ